MYIPAVHRRDGTAIFEQDLPGQRGQSFVGREDVAVHEEEEVPGFLRSQANLDRIEAAGESYSRKAEHTITKLMTVLDENAIERDTFRKVIDDQSDRQRSCLSLPFSLVFFVMFSISSFLHEDITNVFLVESGLRRKFSSGLDEVNDIDGVWTWVRQTLVANIFIQTDHLGLPLPPSEFNRVLMYNQLHGPLLLEQSRSIEEPCTDSDGIAPDMRCFPLDTDSTEADFGRSVNCMYNSSTCLYYSSSFSPTGTAVQGRLLRQMRPEHLGELPKPDVDDGNYQVLVFPTTGVGNIYEHIDYLYQRGWLDIFTKSLTVKALFLNAEVGRPRLEQLKVYFSFSRGGGVFHRLTLESLFLEPFDGALSIISDSIVIVMLVVATVFEVIDAIKSGREIGLKRYLVRGRTWLETMIILLGWLCVAGYAVQHVLRENVQDSLLEVVREDMDAITVGGQRMDWVEYLRRGGDLHSDADDMISFSSYLRILVSEYHLLLMVRFFTAFRAQPRLGVVTMTLAASITDIAHFMVVLIPTFLAFAVSGAFIFGRRMQEFSTFDGAIAMCFKMAMEGEYDWPQLSEEHWWTAALWVWTFMVLLVLLMLNMVLAIIMDVYTEMRQNTTLTVTVLESIMGGIWRVWHFRQWVRTQDLRSSCDTFESIFDKGDLKKKFETMPAPQLAMIERDCRYQMEAMTAGMDLKDSMKMCLSVKLRMDQVAEEIESLIGGRSSAVDTTGVENTWLADVSREMAVQNHMMLTLQWELQRLQAQWQAFESLNGDGKPPEASLQAPQQLSEEVKL